MWEWLEEENKAYVGVVKTKQACVGVARKKKIRHMWGWPKQSRHMWEWLEEEKSGMCGGGKTKQACVGVARRRK